MKNWCDVEAKKGDIVRFNAGLYYHYGIYVGNGEVVEFGSADAVSKNNTEDIIVNRVSVESFSKGNFVEVAVLDKKDKKRSFKPEIIVERALSMIGTGGYDFIHNNCQHFVNYCTFGKKVSEDVDAVRLQIISKIEKAKNK